MWHWTISTGGSNIHFTALKPENVLGGGVGSQPFCALTHPSYLPSPDLSRYPFRDQSTLTELTVTLRALFPN